jgi:hypothetical protein
MGGLPAEVSRSLESVWSRHAGAAPKEVETVIRASTIICTIRDDTVELGDGIVDARRRPAEGDGAQSTYRAEALAAVTEATGRRVKYFVSRSDSAAGTATEIFTLDEA